MKKLQIVLISGVLSVSILLLAATPQWIQYSERVVGENSPYYEDVVNRPMKQIWGNFTSQHNVAGEHKTFIFPTPIPTLPFPTPFPTATPKPDATPQPTATPKPDATPQPTATPVNQAVLSHPTNTDLHLYFLNYIGISSLPYTVPTENGACHGILLVAMSPGTITLPSNTDVVTSRCHTIRIAVTNNTGATIVTAGSGSTFMTNGGDKTSYTSSATPLSFYIEFSYIGYYSQWIPTIIKGTWTAS